MDRIPEGRKGKLRLRTTVTVESWACGLRECSNPAWPLSSWAQSPNKPGSSAPWVLQQFPATRSRVVLGPKRALPPGRAALALPPPSLGSETPRPAGLPGPHLRPAPGVVAGPTAPCQWGSPAAASWNGNGERSPRARASGRMRHASP